MSRKKEIPNLDDLLRRYVAGESEQKLAAEAGVNRCAFRNRIVKAGIIPRNNSGAMKIRWANASEGERNAMLDAAHSSMRGVPLSDELKIKQAIGKQNSLAHISHLDALLWAMLQDSGLNVTPQKAVYAYNIDVAVEAPPIAVELFGGAWHSAGRHGARFHERTKYLLDIGWTVVVVWVDKRRYPFGVGCVEYIVSLAKTLRLDPPARGEYRVILGDGNLAPVAKSYLNTPADIERLGSG